MIFFWFLVLSGKNIKYEKYFFSVYLFFLGEKEFIIAKYGTLIEGYIIMIVRYEKLMIGWAFILSLFSLWVF